MINYSIYPVDLVFEDYDNFDIKYEEIVLDTDTTLMVERIDEGQVKIDKIISTNPQNYLRPELQPGSTIKFSINMK